MVSRVGHIKKIYSGILELQTLTMCDRETFLCIFSFFDHLRAVSTGSVKKLFQASWTALPSYRLIIEQLEFKSIHPSNAPLPFFFNSHYCFKLYFLILSFLSVHIAQVLYSISLINNSRKLK